LSEEPSGEQKEYRRPDGTFAPGVVQPGARLWQPGESGNPSGAPKGRPSLAAALRRVLSEGGVDDEGVSERAMQVARALWAQACADPAAQKILWDRVEGAVPKDLNLQGQIVTVKRLVIDDAPEDLQAPESP
jgi:hypothetical protein